MEAFISPTLPSVRATAHRRPHICMASEDGGSDNKAPQDPPANAGGAAKEPKNPKKTIQSRATWNNTFLPIFGSKGPGSRPDWDLRPISLRKEDDNKAGICDNCKGSGVMVCSFCQGGKFHVMDDTMVKCPACSGQTEVVCSVCYGSKKQIELVRQHFVSIS